MAAIATLVFATVLLVHASYAEQNPGEWLIGRWDGTLDFPLQVGKTWQYTFYGQTSNGLGQFIQGYRVVACEEVATPAGKFPAFRLEGTLRGPRGSGTFYLFICGMPLKRSNM